MITQLKKVTRVLDNSAYDIILNVLDSTNLQRNLYYQRTCLDKNDYCFKYD